jgi:hypothetical protein
MNIEDDPNLDLMLSKRNYNRVDSYRRRLKRRLVEYKGGCCALCGYNNCVSALEFHHVDPSKKDFTISNALTMSFDKCKSEVDKCILVCSNCHKEIHDKEYEEKRINRENEENDTYIKIMSNRDEYSNIVIRDPIKYLEHTDIMDDIKNDIGRDAILSKYHIANGTLNKFLSIKGIIYRPKKVAMNKPSKDELIKLLSTYSKSSIGRMFGVSCSAVMKWCKKYNI